MRKNKHFAFLGTITVEKTVHNFEFQKFLDYCYQFFKCLNNVAFPIKFEEVINKRFFPFDSLFAFLALRESASFYHLNSPSHQNYAFIAVYFFINFY